MQLLRLLFKIFFSLDEKLRFILVGGFNTFIGITLFATLYLLFKDYTSYLLIFICSSLISILISCFTLKFFVFHKTREGGNIISQISKAFVGQILLAIISSAGMYILVSLFRANPILSQIIITLLVAIKGYFFHKRISFH